jgi:hypothetical protein
MSNFFKIYGLRTSGTNWLQWLIENNIEDSVVFRNQLGWKHGNPTNILDWSGDIIEWDDKSNLGNEYTSVLKSIQNERLNNNKTIMEIKDEVDSVFSSESLIHCFIVKNPYNFMNSRLNRNKDLATEIKDWNDRIKSYFDFDYKSKVMISYEKLNMNPKNVLGDIANKFGLKINKDFRDIDSNLTHGFNVNGTRKILDENFENYFKSQFDKSTLNKIESMIDSESLKLYKSL